MTWKLEQKLVISWQQFLIILIILITLIVLAIPAVALRSDLKLMTGTYDGIAAAFVAACFGRRKRK
jgi:hypothetical protein